MKQLLTAVAALSAILLIGACDRQSFDETKALHSAYHQGHGDAAKGHHEDKAASAAHGAADAHAKPTEHGEKKEH